jgi:uncharacterized peroxidase-related enzyme
MKAFCQIRRRNHKISVKEIAMPRIQPLTMDSASADAKKIFEGIKAKLGKVPNIYATMAHSPVTLQAMLHYNQELRKGSLSGREIEVIALAVGQANDCDYCVAAHTVIGKMAGLSVEETIESRQGKGHDPKLDALVKLAIDITKTGGRPSDQAIVAFRKAGYSDAALIEVIAWVTYNIFTNYFNHIAETVSDFPAPPALK